MSNSHLCPLCQQPLTACNALTDAEATGCWCRAPAVVFPPNLLAQVPADQRGKACICKACYQAHMGQRA